MKNEILYKRINTREGYAYEPVDEDDLECACCCHHSHCECMNSEGCKHCNY